MASYIYLILKLKWEGREEEGLEDSRDKQKKSREVGTLCAISQARQYNPSSSVILILVPPRMIQVSTAR